MDQAMREEVWRELLRRERFGRVLGSQCFIDGFNTALMVPLGGDQYYPSSSSQGRCDPQRCILYYDPMRCKRTAPLYGEGFAEGQESARRWLEDLQARRWDGRRCAHCGGPVVGRRSKRYCCPACRVAAHRARQDGPGSCEAVTAVSVTGKG